MLFFCLSFTVRQFITCFSIIGFFKVKCYSMTLYESFITAL